MHADEYRLRLQEVELHVPAIFCNDMDSDLLSLVMWTAGVVGACAASNDAGDKLRRDLACLKLVLLIDVAPARLMSVAPLFQSFKHRLASADAGSPALFCQG